jgi:predicted RNA-binding Zn-ribbon protein involved in translation (DUF1610 family)
MSGISGPAVYPCPWCGRSVEQGESCWCKQSQGEAMSRQELRAELKEARAERDRLTAENERMREALGRILDSGNLFAHYAVARAAIRPEKDHSASRCPECGYQPGAIPCDYRACAQAWCERKELHAELDRRAAAGS